jgi:hypothetical protein
MSTPFLAQSASIPLVRLPLTASAWTQVQATGWTISNPTPSTLRLAWAGGSLVDWTASDESGLALVYPVKLGTLSDAARHCRMQIAYSEATADGIGLGVGFTSAAAVVGQKWVNRSEHRDGAGTVHVRDEADSAGAPFSSAGQTRRGVICMEIESLTTTMAWGKVAGSAGSYNERRYAGTHITFTEGGDVYAVIFGLGDTTAGSVDITGIGLQFRELESL